MPDNICLNCNKLYVPRSGKQKKFCSDYCGNRFWYKNHREEVNTRLRTYQRKHYNYAGRPTEPIACGFCQKTFLPNRQKQKCCSRRCACRLRYENNPEKYRQKAKRLRQNNLEKHRARDKQYSIVHREEVSERRRQFRIQNPWWSLIRGAKSRSKASNMPFNLSDAWAKNRWNGCCELTGIPFTIGMRDRKIMFAPSIDKIIPELGYVQTNCRIILHCLNLFKFNGTDDQMYQVAEQLLAHRRILSSSRKDSAHAQFVPIGNKKVLDAHTIQT